MKILFVATVYRHLTAFHIPHMKYFQSLGYEVWAASGEGEEDRKLLEQENVRCINISFSRSPKSRGNIKAIKQMRNLLAQENFQFVDVHTPIASFITRYAAKNLEQVKVIYTAHGFHFYKGAPLVNWLLYYTAEKIAAPWTEHLITINEEDYEVTKRLNISENNTSYIHGVGVEIIENKLDEMTEKQLKAEFSITKSDVVISYVAEMNENKNHLFLLENWSEIKRSAPTAKLLLIGHGSYEKRLKQYVDMNNLKDIIFTGYRRDVNNILKITDIVTLLSKREGLPKSIMEAMASSLPCIVSNTRGLRDLIQNKKSGYVVNLEDNHSLCTAFIDLVNCPEVREGYGKQARLDIEIYTVDNVLREYAEIYKKLLGEVIE